MSIRPPLPYSFLLTAFITQTEDCMNTRPLIALSKDPNDSIYLSKGHFLIGAPLPYRPEPDYQYNNEQLIQMAASSTLQSEVVENMAI
jgi:hypothetical protein